MSPRSTPSSVAEVSAISQTSVGANRCPDLNGNPITP